MPFKSEAQRRYFNANRKELEAQGVDVDEWNNSSRGKKLPARTKEAQVKRAQVKYLLKQAIAAKDLVNMDSADGAAADYITPMAWGGERAGRTQAMADAIGENTTFGVRHPMTQTLGHVLGGAGVGGLAGGLAGGILNSTLAALQGRRLGNGFLAGAGAGTGLGMAAGAIGGRYSAGRSRRNEMRRINQLFDQDNAAGKVKPKDPELSTLAALFAPLRGAHRTGQVEAVRAMRENTPISEQRGTLRDPLHAASTVLGPLAGIPIGYGQNLKTQLTNGETKEKEQVPERRPKTASAIEKLAYVLARNPQLKQANLNSFMSNLPSPLGTAAAGAIGGGLGGLLTNPGVDEQGRPNSRFRRALGGAALGGLGGYGLGHVMHGGVPMLNGALSRFKGQRADSENAAPGTFENPAANPLMADQLNEENAFYHGMNYPMHVDPQVVGGDINMNPRMPGLA